MCSSDLDRYEAVIQKLLSEDKAYYCYCSKEEVATMRETQKANKQKPRYDGHCRHRTGPPPADIKPVVRFKNPLEGTVIIDDLVKGRVAIQNTELDDLIIARSDGSPTYNLTVVVDDLEMGISHVIRGDDHLNNTPRQINILKALGADIPFYAHLPMILGADGARLSKRHGAVSVMQYRAEGYLPEAFLNYLARLGWSHGDQEVFSIDEMIKLFKIEKVNKAAAAFNPEKLLWLNQHYIKESDPAHIARHLSWHLGQRDIDPSNGPELLEVIKTLQERSKTLVEMAEGCRFFYQGFESYDEKAARKNLKPGIQAPLQDFRDKLEQLPGWDQEQIHKLLEQTCAAHELKLGKLAQPIRVAVAGCAVSPPIDITRSEERRVGKECRSRWSPYH